MWRDAAALLLSVRDPRAGAPAKWVALLAALYVVSPIDLLPDGIPLLGLTDDLFLVPAVLAFAARRLPAPVLAQARSQVARWPRVSLVWLLLVAGLGLALLWRWPHLP